MRRIYINFKKSSKIGGPQTFMKNLQNEFNSLGYSYTSNLLFANAIFFPISTKLKKIKIIKALGGKVIQRLDGIYTSPETIHANENIQYIYNRYSDHVIFQSEYSRKQVFSMFGGKDSGNYDIVFNGANEKIFSAKNNHSIDGRIRLISTANFRKRSMIKPIIEACNSLEQRGYPVTLTLVGPINFAGCEDILHDINNSRIIEHKIIHDQFEIADCLRQSHIFLYSFLNAPCPNSIIEAISCGLPVVGFDSGSMNELCRFSRELLVEMPDRLIHQDSEIDVQAFINAIQKCIDNYTCYSLVSKKHAQDYTMKRCAQNYIDTFSRARI